jgi:hypothetical protein
MGKRGTVIMIKRQQRAIAGMAETDRESAVIQVA